MSALRSILVTGAFLLVPIMAEAQMSTFPNPPSLAPAPDRSPADATNVPSAIAPANSADAPEPSSSKTATATPRVPSPPVIAATLNSMSALDDKTSLEPGDTISYRVIEDEEDAVTRVVGDTGEVSLPYIGRVKVQGKTCHQVALDVKRLCEANYYKHATVIVGLDLIVGDDKQKPRDLVWVVGEVRNEGPQELTKVNPMTVSQIILRAGGFDSYADQRKIKIVHRSGKTPADQPPDLSSIKDAQVVDIKEVFDGKSAYDPLVKPGDYIIVPKVFIKFY